MDQKVNNGECVLIPTHLTVHVNNTSFLSADIPISVGPDSEWNHVAVVFDTGQLSDIQLYINGVQPARLCTEDVSINTDSGDNVIVGNPPNGCSIQITDLQVYSIPLLDWEVSWLSDPNYSVRTAKVATPG